MESTYTVVSEAVKFLTRPVRYICSELFACLASVLRFKFTSFVKIIFGGFTYPEPGSVTVKPDICPWLICAVAYAPIPPPPVIKTNGGSW